MPTYEYNCKKCSLSREEFHAMNEEPEIICDACKEKMIKIISGGAGFIFKNGTRKMTHKQRYGNRRKSSQPTPSESAEAKAQQRSAETAYEHKSKTDPYHEFR